MQITNKSQGAGKAGDMPDRFVSDFFMIGSLGKRPGCKWQKSVYKPFDSCYTLRRQKHPPIPREVADLERFAHRCNAADFSLSLFPGDIPMKRTIGLLVLTVLLFPCSFAAAGKLLYQDHSFFGSPSTDSGKAVAVDKSGNIYLTGYSNSSWSFPPGMFGFSPKHAHSGKNDIFIIKLDSNGKYLWHTFYGSAEDDYAYDIAVDEAGNVYVAGTSRATWSGPGFLGSPKYAHSGSEDMVLIKLNSSGDYQWHAFYGSSTYDSAYDMTLDSDNIFLFGSSTGNWSLDGTAPLHAHSGSLDIVVIKLTYSGEPVWHTFYGSSDVDYGSQISLDSSGSVLVAGWSYYSWNGPGGQSPNNDLNSFYDIMVLKLDGEGTYQWHTFYGSPDIDMATGLAISRDDGFFLTGRSNSSWSGPSDTLPHHQHSGSYDVFVAGFNKDGSYAWHTFYGSQQFDQTANLAIDRTGNLLLTGQSTSSWNGPGNIPPASAHSGVDDIFLLHLNSKGAYLSHSFFGTVAFDYGLHVMTKSDGGVYVTGKSDASWSGPDGESPRYAHKGGSDAFLLRLVHTQFPAGPGINLLLFE